MTEIDYKLDYPESERKLKFEIEKLNDRWKNHLVSMTGEKSISEIFVSDGFYPYYTNQKVKVLFIGREALEIAGTNYQESLYKQVSFFFHLFHLNILSDNHPILQIFSHC